MLFTNGPAEQFAKQVDVLAQTRIDLGHAALLNSETKRSILIRRNRTTVILLPAGCPARPVMASRNGTPGSGGRPYKGTLASSRGGIVGTIGAKKPHKK